MQKKWISNAVTERYALEQSEHGRDHDTGDTERILMKAVAGGDIETMRHLMEVDENHIGVMAKVPEKQQEYICVVAITLFSRAAVYGGLSREEAYSLADVYMQRLEQCRTVGEIQELTGQVGLDFATRVHAVLEERSKPGIIKDCKAYIAANLRKPFKIGDIAPAIGVNRSYLAKRFSQVEGITLQQYVLKERCAHAAELLLYSDYPLPLIAEYFCFSSQSHFGRVFKALYGMTPGEFRNSQQQR